jgi:hypothetical protein
MSLSIGLHAGRYVVIASDCREGFYRGDTMERLSYHDGATKVVKTPIGLIVGTGLSALVNAVQRRLAEEPARDTDTILQIIGECRQAVADDPSLPANLKAKGLETTSWILTYRTTVNSEQVLRLATYHPANGHGGLELMGEGGAVVAVPDVSPEQEPSRRELRESLLPSQLNDLRVCHLDDEVTPALMDHLSMVRGLIAESAALVDSISPVCQVAFHMVQDGFSFVSEILPAAGTLQLHVADGQPTRIPADCSRHGWFPQRKEP